MDKSALLQKAKPLLFSTPMAAAILAGRKSMTRRVVKPQPENEWNYTRIDDYFKFYNPYDDEMFVYVKPRYKKGDILYVRETWGTYHINWRESDYFVYRVDYPNNAKSYLQDDIKCDLPKWKPSIHMPKAAARLFLRLTDVRAERLRDISDDDILAEGIKSTEKYPVEKVGRATIFDRVNCKNQFEDLWNSLNAKRDGGAYSWEANPWVFVYSFERIVPGTGGVRNNGTIDK